MQEGKESPSTSASAGAAEQSSTGFLVCEELQVVHAIQNPRLLAGYLLDKLFLSPTSSSESVTHQDVLTQMQILSQDALGKSKELIAALEDDATKARDVSGAVEPTSLAGSGSSEFAILSGFMPTLIKPLLQELQAQCGSMSPEERELMLSQKITPVLEVFFDQIKNLKPFDSIVDFFSILLKELQLRSEKLFWCVMQLCQDWKSPELFLEGVLLVLDLGLKNSPLRFLDMLPMLDSFNKIAALDQLEAQKKKSEEKMVFSPVVKSAVDILPGIRSRQCTQWHVAKFEGSHYLMLVTSNEAMTQHDVLVAKVDCHETELSRSNVVQLELPTPGEVPFAFLNVGCGLVILSRTAEKNPKGFIHWIDASALVIFETCELHKDFLFPSMEQLCSYSRKYLPPAKSETRSNVKWDLVASDPVSGKIMCVSFHAVKRAKYRSVVFTAEAPCAPFNMVASGTSPRTGAAGATFFSAYMREEEMILEGLTGSDTTLMFALSSNSLSDRPSTMKVNRDAAKFSGNLLRSSFGEASESFVQFNRMEGRMEFVALESPDAQKSSLSPAQQCVQRRKELWSTDVNPADSVLCTARLVNGMSFVPNIVHCHGVLDFIPALVDRCLSLCETYPEDTEYGKLVRGMIREMIMLSKEVLQAGNSRSQGNAGSHEGTSRQQKVFRALERIQEQLSASSSAVDISISEDIALLRLEIYGLTFSASDIISTIRSSLSSSDDRDRKNALSILRFSARNARVSVRVVLSIPIEEGCELFSYFSDLLLEVVQSEGTPDSSRQEFLHEFVSLYSGACWSCEDLSSHSESVVSWISLLLKLLEEDLSLSQKACLLAFVAPIVRAVCCRSLSMVPPVKSLASFSGEVDDIPSSVLRHWSALAPRILELLLVVSSIPSDAVPENCPSDTYNPWLASVAQDQLINLDSVAIPLRGFLEATVLLAPFLLVAEVSKDQKARAKKSDLHFFFNQTCFPLQGLDSIVSTHSSEDSDASSSSVCFKKTSSLAASEEVELLQLMLKNQLEKYLVGSSSLCFGPITAPSETTIAGKSLENRFANVLYQKYSRSSSGAAGLQEGYEACELALQAVCLKALASPEDIQSVVVQLVAGVESELVAVPEGMVKIWKDTSQKCRLALGKRRQQIQAEFTALKSAPNAAASLQTEEVESEFLATHFDIAVQQFLRKCDLLFCFRHGDFEEHYIAPSSTGLISPAVRSDYDPFKSTAEGSTPKVFDSITTPGVGRTGFNPFEDPSSDFGAAQSQSEDFARKFFVDIQKFFSREDIDTKNIFDHAVKTQEEVYYHSVGLQLLLNLVTLLRKPEMCSEQLTQTSSGEGSSSGHSFSPFSFGGRIVWMVSMLLFRRLVLAQGVVLKQGKSVRVAAAQPSYRLADALVKGLSHVKVKEEQAVNSLFEDLFHEVIHLMSIPSMSKALVPVIACMCFGFHRSEQFVQLLSGDTSPLEFSTLSQLLCLLALNAQSYALKALTTKGKVVTSARKYAGALDALTGQFLASCQDMLSLSSADAAVDERLLRFGLMVSALCKQQQLWAKDMYESSSTGNLDVALRAAQAAQPLLQKLIEPSCLRVVFQVVVCPFLSASTFDCLVDLLSLTLAAHRPASVMEWSAGEQGFLSLLELAAQRCGDIHFLGQQEKDDVESRAAEVLLASVKVSFGQKSTPHATLQFPNTCFNALRLQSLREHESGLSSSASSKAAASSSGSSEGASSDSSSQPTSSAEGLVPVDNFFANSVVRLVQALCLYSAEWRDFFLSGLIQQQELLSALGLSETYTSSALSIKLPTAPVLLAFSRKILPARGDEVLSNDKKMFLVLPSWEEGAAVVTPVPSTLEEVNTSSSNVSKVDLVSCVVQSSLPRAVTSDGVSPSFEEMQSLLLASLKNYDVNSVGTLLSELISNLFDTKFTKADLSLADGHESYVFEKDHVSYRHNTLNMPLMWTSVGPACNPEGTLYFEVELMKGSSLSGGRFAVGVCQPGSLLGFYEVINQPISHMRVGCGVGNLDDKSYIFFTVDGVLVSCYSMFSGPFAPCISLENNALEVRVISTPDVSKLESRVRKLLLATVATEFSVFVDTSVKRKQSITGQTKFIQTILEVLAPLVSFPVSEGLLSELIGLAGTFEEEIKNESLEDYRFNFEETLPSLLSSRFEALMRLIVDLTTKAEKMNLRTERDGILLGQLLLKELERGKQDPFMVGKALKRLLAKLNGAYPAMYMLNVIAERTEAPAVFEKATEILVHRLDEQNLLHNLVKMKNKEGTVGSNLVFQALKKRGLEFFTEKFLSDSQCVDTLSLEEYSSVLGLVKASKGEDPVSKEKKVVSSKAGPSGSASKAAVSAKPKRDIPRESLPPLFNARSMSMILKLGESKLAEDTVAGMAMFPEIERERVDAAGFSESLPPFFDEEFAMSIWKEIALSRGPDSHTLEIDSVDTTVGHVDDSDHTLKIVVEGTTVPGGHVVVPLSVLDFLSPLSGPSSLPVVSASDFRQSAQSSVSGADKGVGPNGFVENVVPLVRGFTPVSCRENGQSVFLVSSTALPSVQDKYSVEELRCAFKSFSASDISSESNWPCDTSKLFPGTSVEVVMNTPGSRFPPKKTAGEVVRVVTASDPFPSQYIGWVGVKFENWHDGHSLGGALTSPDESDCGYFVPSSLLKITKSVCNVSTWELGARVEAITQISNITAGATGTIVHLNSSTSMGVEWDQAFPGLHNCNGHASSGNGWYVENSNLRIISKPVVYPEVDWSVIRSGSTGGASSSSSRKASGAEKRAKRVCSSSGASDESKTLLLECRPSSSLSDFVVDMASLAYSDFCSWNSHDEITSGIRQALCFLGSIHGSVCFRGQRFDLSSNTQLFKVVSMLELLSDTAHLCGRGRSSFFHSFLLDKDTSVLMCQDVFAERRAMTEHPMLSRNEGSSSSGYSSKDTWTTTDMLSLLDAVATAAKTPPPSEGSSSDVSFAPIKDLLQLEKIRRSGAFVISKKLRENFPTIGSRTPEECLNRFKLVWNLNKVFVDLLGSKDSEGSLSVEAIMNLLHATGTVSSLKESLFSETKAQIVNDAITKFAVGKTQVNQPEIHIRRIDAAEGRAPSVFEQVFTALPFATWKAGRFHFKRERLFTVQLTGEHAIDAGGPFREVMTHMAQELNSSRVDLFVPTPNSLHMAGATKGQFYPNPARVDERSLDLFRFAGLLMAFGVVNNCPFPLSFSPIFFKKLAREDVSVEDYCRHVDNLEWMQSLGSAVAADCKFVIPSCNPEFSIELVDGGKSIAVTAENFAEFQQLVFEKRLKEVDVQMAAISEGMSLALPLTEFSLLSWKEFEEKICGNPDITVEQLKTVCNVSLSQAHADMFWETMSRFTPRDRESFLRFASGYRRIPANAEQWGTRVTVTSRGSFDGFPTAGTCSSYFSTPEYSSVERMMEQYRTAFECAEIDAD